MPADRPVPDREVPEGYELVAVEEKGTWRLAEGKHCRWGAGYRKRACGRPCAAQMARTQYRKGRTITVWWAYCADHLYGRWIEDGKVMCWILREKSDA